MIEKDPVKIEENCIFCKIISGSLPCAKIWENEDYLAFLDLMPNTKGMTLVITKQHYDSYVYGMPNSVYRGLMDASKQVAKMLEKGLGVNRVAMVMEGMGINHAHIKLYPLHGVSKEFKEMWAKDKIYFDKYEGYLSTQTGPKKDLTYLN